MSGRWIWVGALALTLAVLALHSVVRLRQVEAVTERRVGAGLAPEADAGSPTGYRWGEHRLVLPETDSYLWLLQVEEALASGSLRVREAGYDNAPDGREVHWAGFERWWMIAVASAHGLVHPELTPAQSLERVAPWANTLLLGIFLLVLTPLVAVRLGAIPAAVLCAGCVAVFPFYEYVRVGYVDHHGPAVLFSVASILCLVLGGAGWVRPPDERPLEATPWPPAPASARRWFVASGVAAGIGLWISAATMAPVLIGVGLGSLVGVGAARGATATTAGRLEPTLFRAWGVAGAVASLSFYLVEYFPAHLGMRLEVNHPLYALAFFGGGDLIARVARLTSASSRGERVSRPSLGWVAADLGMVLLLPAVVLIAGDATFRVSDPVLWILHNRYINEFLSLATRVLPLSPAELLGRVSLVPLIALPIAALLWPTALPGAWRVGWRAVLVALVAGAAAYTYVVVLGLSGGSRGQAVAGAAAVVALAFLLPLSLRPTTLPPFLQTPLIMVATPALVMLGLALAQERWLGIAAALWLCALVVAAAVLVRVESSGGGRAVRAVAGALAALVLVAAPALALREPYSPPNVAVVERDASLWLRRRVGADRAVVFAGPSATLYMIWFGGFRGIGTLYWENREGLRASAQICAARDPAEARALLARHGVTHVATYAWDSGLEQLMSSAEAAGGRSAWPRLDGRGIQGLCTHAPGELPSWLVPLPYAPPRVAGYEHPVARLFEIRDDLRREVSLVRLARYYQALEDPRMEEALARSLELGPSVAGLAMRAQLESARGEQVALPATLAALRATLVAEGAIAPEDRIEAALGLALGRDVEGATRQLGQALAQSDERTFRRLSPQRLALVVDLSRQLGLDRLYPDPIAVAERLSSGG